MRNWEYHLNGRGNKEPDYTEQVRFERQLEGLGLSDDTIAYVLANPPALNAAYRMISKNPQLSLEVAIMRCWGKEQEPKETESVANVHGMPLPVDYTQLSEEGDRGDQEELTSNPLHIETVGNFIPMKKVRRSSDSTSVADCSFSRLPEKYRMLVECQVLGLHRDDPFNSSHSHEHAISYERD